MLVTEEEAKKKRCPIMSARRYSEESIANTTYLKPIYLKCEASECMAWRWSKKTAELMVLTDVPEKDRRGYCGLAGNPEES